MPAIGELIDPAVAERLAAAVAGQQRQRQADEATPPVQARCPECGQPMPSGRPATSAHDERPATPADHWGPLTLPAAPAALFIAPPAGAEHPA